MYSKGLSKSLKIIISVNSLLLFVIPIGYSFGPLDLEDMNSEFGWYPDYFYTNELSLLFIAPFYLLWGGYLVNKDATVKVTLRFLLLASSAFYAFCCFMSVTMISPDWQPYWGLIMLFMLCPLLVIFFLLEFKASKIKENTFHVDAILDEDIF